MLISFLPLEHPWGISRHGKSFSIKPDPFGLQWRLIQIKHEACALVLAASFCTLLLAALTYFVVFHLGNNIAIRAMQDYSLKSVNITEQWTPSSMLKLFYSEPLQTILRMRCQLSSYTANITYCSQWGTSGTWTGQLQYVISNEAAKPSANSCQYPGLIIHVLNVYIPRITNGLWMGNNWDLFPAEPSLGECHSRNRLCAGVPQFKSWHLIC